VKKLILLLFVCVTFNAYLQAAQLPVAMGPNVSGFSVLAGAGVTNTGYSTVNNGNLGVSPGSAVTGFPPGSVSGAIYTGAGSLAGTAQGELTTAYNDALSRTGFTTVAGNLDGQTLTPGLYKSTSTLGLGVGGILYLTGAANSVFIFQVGSALNMGTGSQVILSGGVTAANIFWQVGSSATIGTTAIFNGTILAYASITVNTGAAMNGRALAQTGTVTLDTNTMVNPGPAYTGGTPPALALTCPLATAIVGVPYNSLLVATGGAPSYTYSIASGSLPTNGSPAFSLNPSTGAIAGTPTATTCAGPGSCLYSFGGHVVDTIPNSADASCGITVVPATAAADVSIVKTGPAAVIASGNITYTLTVTNAGPASAAAVTVTDILPAGTTYVSATPSPAGSSCSGTSTVICSLGTMPSSGAGSSATIQLVVVAPSAGSVVNTATVVSTTPDSNTSNNRSTASLTISGSASVPALSTWGLALLALLLAGCSAQLIRKARV
jgi:uncharacterized repeat protein (TIGR01451 family)